MNALISLVQEQPSEKTALGAVRPFTVWAPLGARRSGISQRNPDGPTLALEVRRVATDSTQGSPRSRGGPLFQFNNPGQSGPSLLFP